MRGLRLLGRVTETSDGHARVRKPARLDGGTVSRLLATLRAADYVVQDLVRGGALAVEVGPTALGVPGQGLSKLERTPVHDRRGHAVGLGPGGGVMARRKRKVAAKPAPKLKDEPCAVCGTHDARLDLLDKLFVEGMDPTR